MHIVFPAWEGLPLIPSHAAANELFREGLNLADVREALEEGVDSGRRRAEGVVERVLQRGSRSLKVVVARDYNHTLELECWVVVHVKSVRA